MLQIHRYPGGPRVYVGRHRVHHGTVGCALAIVGAWTHSRTVLAIGVALVVHDSHDWRAWMPDALRREPLFANQ